MKRIFKKSLSLALSLALLFSVAPISFAENTAEAPGGTELASESEQAAETDQAAESEADTDSEQVTESEQSTEPKQGEASAEEKSESDAEASKEASPEASEKAAEESAPEALQEGESELGAEFDNEIGTVEYPEPQAFYGTLSTSKGGMQPGELSISKTATPSKDEGVWDIELSLTGKDVIQSTDIVLVIDSSGSMHSQNRMENAKKAAKNFIQKELTEKAKSYTRIAVVSFSDNARIEQNLTNDADLLNQAVEKLSASGGTHTQAGLYQAELILKDSPGNKVIILLSDGEPTYGYDVKDGYKEYTQKYILGAWETTVNLPCDLINFDFSIGNGASIREWKEGYFPRYYVNHGNVAIVLANHLREKGHQIYAVGLSLNQNAKEVMKGIGKEKYYDAESDSLNQVYDEIAGKINYAAGNAVVKDPMGSMFNIVDSGSIQITDKNGKPLPGTKISWESSDTQHPNGHYTAEIGSISEKLSPIKIKYQVKIKAGVVPGELYETNGETTVTYTDSDGKVGRVKKFDVPKAGLKAASIKVYALFVDKDDKLLKSSEADFGTAALDKQDNPLSVDFLKDEDTNSISLKIDKAYTVTAEPYITKMVGSSKKTFVLDNQIKKVSGTAANSEIETSKSPYTATFTKAGSKEIYFVYKLQEKANYKVRHVLQLADGSYDFASAVTETIEGSIGTLTQAKAKTGRDGAIDYDYFTPLAVKQKSIEADGSTEIEIRYDRNYVTLKANSDIKKYDGTKQTVEGFSADVVGEEFEDITASGSGTDAGEYTATFQEEKEKLEAKSGRKYFAKYETGKLIIEKADGLKDAFKLEINGYTGVYDGATHEPDIKGDLSELTVTHSVAKANDWKAGLPSIKDVSEQTYDIKFEHKNYLDFVAEEVLLKVTPKKASITAGSKSKVYDGIALTDNSFTTADFVTGEGVASAVIKGSIIDAGSVANVVESYELAVGTLATNYEIELINGTLTVTAKKVEDTGSDDRERHSIVTTDSDDEDTETIQDDQTPLARLNNQDHFAYLSGYPDGSFRPHDALTREQVAAIFFRLLDKEDREKIRSEQNDFSDVEAHRWSNKHISTLSNGKIFSGYADGSFKPEQSVTRAELAVIASKFDKLETGAEHKFTDIKGHWAEKYIASAVKKGWINSYEDNTFRPEQNITRAEFVSFVNNVLNRHVKLEDILEHSAEFSDVTEKTVWYYCPIKCATNSYLFEESKSTENATVKFQKWTKLTTPIIEM
ncbi:MAG: S-layer homology domain-containing protein [Bacillota bacterium]|nr:S-layer homology domain-containing protein [Bacillota bacterium]